MPIDSQKLSETKERMISFMKIKGPSLPVQLASHVQMSPLFTSAFLSEMFAEKRIKISNMRVGSSPLYYLAGQEAMLDNFIQFLNNKEKEAFSLLKEKKLLEDSALSPSIRVAIKEIRDFAVPIKIRMDNEVKLFWRYHQTSEDEIRQIIQPISARAPVKSEEKPKEKVKEEAVKQVTEEKEDELEESQEQLALSAPVSKKKEKTIDSDFVNGLKEYLAAKDVEILEILSEKKKEFSAKVRIDILFGKQEYYLVAKDKKNVNESDLSGALQKAQAEKMPALFMCAGELHKKAHPYLKDWKNLVKFEKLNF